MPRVAGETLGPYTILSPLGAGGMGEVYRARDAKLGREVAIEISPELRIGPPRIVRDGGFVTYSTSRSEGVYEVTPDGRFIMIEPYNTPGTDAPLQTDQLTVVIH